MSERVAIVTGGGSGIGRAICLALAEASVSVAVTDVNLPGAQAVAGEITARGRASALAIHADVSNPISVREMGRAILDRFGRIDILVNNAGIGPVTPFFDITLEEWDRVLRVNLTGMFLCAQVVMPVMMKASYGRIVNISSLAGKVGGIAASVHYAVSKAGVLGLTKSLARLSVPYGITVNAVAPGPADTPMNYTFSEEERARLLAGVPLGRCAQPEEVATAVVFLASDGASYITGETLDVNGGALMD